MLKTGSHDDACVIMQPECLCVTCQKDGRIDEFDFCCDKRKGCPILKCKDCIRDEVPEKGAEIK